MRAARTVRMYRDVVWHATSSAEAEEVRRFSGRNACVHVVPNLGPPVGARVRTIAKRAASLRVLFLSRVSPKKNLLAAIDVLRDVSGDVHFAIAGPVDDDAYWMKCEKALRSMPSNIKVEVLGPVLPEDVARLIDEYHVLLLPTLGENYGHVIVETLSRGRPVVISDRTPWDGLESAGAGWAIPLEDTKAFRSALSVLVAADSSQYDLFVEAAHTYAQDKIRGSDILVGLETLFGSLTDSQELV